VMRPGPVKPLSRGYFREKNVEREIEKLIGKPDRDLERSLEASGDDAVRPETTLYFARDFVNRGSPDRAWPLIERLAQRMAPRISRRLSVWKSLSGYLREEVEEALLEKLYRAWLSVEPAHEFWEIRFYVTLDRALADEIDRVLRRAGAEEKLDLPEDEGLDPWDLVADKSPLTPEMSALILDAVSSLPEPQRTAFWLKYREEWTEGEIASHLGCSSRTIRNYLRYAEARIAAWRDGET
jgi:RNA polymerase sigma factor (sigma-70 family)